MHLVIGFSLSGLALYWTWLRPASLRGFRRGWIVGFIQMAANAAVLFTGLRYTRGLSAPRAALGGVLTGLVFAAFMTLLLAANLGYAYRFRRPAWDFGRAWSAAGYSDSGGGSFPRRHRESQTRLRLLQRLREDWENHHRDESPTEYLTAHRAEIEAALDEAAIHGRPQPERA